MIEEDESTGSTQTSAVVSFGFFRKPCKSNDDIMYGRCLTVCYDWGFVATCAGHSFLCSCYTMWRGYSRMMLSSCSHCLYTLNNAIRLTNMLMSYNSPEHEVACSTRHE
ncbi:hypothetical protein AG1IA_09994 [Rhizoctonia solani AG-1 IA]|uniref:Uncharacterized protein n=1 Tax=Thanatephorus cucumeris (strain AG1-IA) TaxID=983506 RepID=L8WCS5_THACA|nr:hypothetical protein AG1IA_09994 [Rhizoctonia solani AG-1 IA]